MKTPLVDHWWTKISESADFGLPAAQDKLRQLAEIERAIAATDGVDAASNVLANGLIRRALERCVEIHQGRPDLDRNDLSIYYNYATIAAKEAERIIDSELDYLDL